MRVMSGSTRPSPTGFQGVWQSLQAMIMTRYFPRSTRAEEAALPDRVLASAAIRRATGERAASSASAVLPRDRMDRIERLLLFVIGTSRF
jgi:hypothetical protein